MDKYFRVEVVSKCPNPQQTIFTAMRQDYVEDFAYDRFNVHALSETPAFLTDQKTGNQIDEEVAGELVVKHLLNGGRGHYGPLEHPQIVLNCGWFPHSTMQQVRTHRVGVSFDCQSFRYTGQRIVEVAKECDLYSFDDSGDFNLIPVVEQVFYLRPAGAYTDRQGNRYEYAYYERQQDAVWCAKAAMRYRDRIKAGFSEEHARGLIPFDIRQHWVMSANVRSLMHLLDLRWKADAQLEAQWLCDLIWPHFEAWVPSIAEWYQANRAKKARLAP